jgi:hypothetical protein
MGNDHEWNAGNELVENNRNFEVLFTNSAEYWEHTKTLGKIPGNPT